MLKSLFALLISVLILVGFTARSDRALKVMGHVVTMHSSDSTESSHHHHDQGHHHHKHKKSKTKHSQKSSHSHEMDLSLNTTVSLIDRKEVVLIIKPTGYFDSTSFFEPSLKQQSYASKIFRPPIA